MRSLRATLLVLVFAAAACGGGAKPHPLVPAGTLTLSIGRDVYLANLDGSHRRRLATVPEAWGATWASDGSRVLVASGTGRDHVSLVTLDRSGHMLGHPGGAFLSHAWSPDGRFVVTDVGPTATAPCQSVHHQLWLGISTARGALVRRLPLLDPSDVASQDRQDELLLTAVAWSPGGRKLAYVASDFDCEEARYGEGWSLVGVLDVRTGARHLVYRGGRTWAYAGPPAWSPGGRAVAFATGCNSGGINGEGCAGYAVANASGRARDHVPEEELADSVAWTPDGRVVFASDTNNDASDVGLRAVDLASGTSAWVVRAPGTGAIADAVDPTWEQSRDRTELITSVVGFFSERNTGGYSALIVTDLARHRKWIYRWRKPIGVYAAGFARGG